MHRLYPEDFENFSIETNPFRSYISNSTSGPTGSVYVFARRSRNEKETTPTLRYSGSFSDENVNDSLERAKINASVSGTNNTNLQNYLDVVNTNQTSLRKQQKVEIIRFVPPPEINSNYLRKTNIINQLMPYYRSSYPDSHYSFINYNCLNFFTASNSNTSSVLLYPITNISSNSVGTLTGSYIFSSSFTFDFWINPRYTTDTSSSVFKAGTILHLSSCYAISLLTGSSKDINGFPDGYRLLLQLSNSSETSPSVVNPNSLPDFSFISDDNSLSRNKWHHVSIRWGSPSYNLGSGSFSINGTNKGIFVITNSSTTPRTFFPTKGNPNVLCVGNYYNGPNSGSSLLAYFFTSASAYRDGVYQMLDGTEFQPVSFSFQHPLNAEISDLKIYNKYLLDSEIGTLSSSGPQNFDNLLFYLPPFFTEEAPVRNQLNGIGGVLISPFYSFNGTTKEPFSKEMAFSSNGHYINLENYTREFVQGTFPRLWDLTASISQVPSVIPQTCNDILYATASNRKRSLSILPNDNGIFYPNFNLLSGLSKNRFVNDLGNTNLGVISLKNLFPSSSKRYDGLQSVVSGTIFDSLVGIDPLLSSTLGFQPKTAYAILQRTKEDSSNQVVMFDISNLYYGMGIRPNTVVLTDTNMSGSDNKIKITLKDDGYGGLYRNDSTGSIATWNSVGNVFYNEGLILLKNPSLYFFGKESFNLQFEGVQNIHSYKIRTLSKGSFDISSSNPSYLPVSASDSPNDKDKRFVYFTGVNIHDSNMNIVMKSTISQPVLKRSSDKFVVEVSIDF